MRIEWVDAARGHRLDEPGIKARRKRRVARVLRHRTTQRATFRMNFGSNRSA